MKKISSVKFLLPLCLGILLLNSCTKKDPFYDENYNSGLILGEKLEDPYRLENMQRAFDSLYGNQLKMELTATHKYVRFLPKNEEEWGLLKKDSNLVLFDYPLDYEVFEGEGSYHDNTIIDTCITWQYTVVPFDYKLPEIEYEILYDVFIPDQQEEELKSYGLSFLDIEEESYRLVGNIDKEDRLKSSRWQPSGRITVDDDLKGKIGVPEASVHTRWCTNIKTCLTDENGYFTQSHGFLYKVNYSIKWERKDFDIRSGNYGQAWYEGPKQKGEWNLHIVKGCMSWMYAHIHRAAITYYYKNSKYGLKSPPCCSGILFEQKLHIGAKQDIGRSKFLDFKKLIQSSQIAIYGYKEKDYKQQYVWYDSYYIFSTTIHELAHASHWQMGYSTLQYCMDFLLSAPVIAESWASCVEWYITKDIYGDVEDKRLNLQSQTTTESMEKGYTSLFIDLIDDYNQKEKHGDDYPIDNVKGYTISQLENALDKTYLNFKTTTINPEVLQISYESFGMSVFKNKIKDSYNNSTESSLDELFNNFKK